MDSQYAEKEYKMLIGRLKRVSESIQRAKREKEDLEFLAQESERSTQRGPGIDKSEHEKMVSKLQREEKELKSCFFEEVEKTKKQQITHLKQLTAGSMLCAAMEDIAETGPEAEKIAEIPEFQETQNLLKSDEKIQEKILQASTASINTTNKISKQLKRHRKVLETKDQEFLEDFKKMEKIESLFLKCYTPGPRRHQKGFNIPRISRNHSQNSSVLILSPDTQNSSLATSQPHTFKHTRKSSKNDSIFNSRVVSPKLTGKNTQNGLNGFFVLKGGNSSKKSKRRGGVGKKVSLSGLKPAKKGSRSRYKFSTQVPSSGASKDIWGPQTRSGVINGVKTDGRRQGKRYFTYTEHRKNNVYKSDHQKLQELLMDQNGQERARLRQSAEYINKLGREISNLEFEEEQLIYKFRGVREASVASNSVSRGRRLAPIEAYLEFRAQKGQKSQKLKEVKKGRKFKSMQNEGGSNASISSKNIFKRVPGHSKSIKSTKNIKFQKRSFQENLSKNRKPVKLSSLGDTGSLKFFHSLNPSPTIKRQKVTSIQEESQSPNSARTQHFRIKAAPLDHAEQSAPLIQRAKLQSMSEIDLDQYKRNNTSIEPNRAQNGTEFSSISPRGLETELGGDFESEDNFGETGEDEGDRESEVSRRASRKVSEGRRVDGNAGKSIFSRLSSQEENLNFAKIMKAEEPGEDLEVEEGTVEAGDDKKRKCTPTTKPENLSQKNKIEPLLEVPEAKKSDEGAELSVEAKEDLDQIIRNRQKKVRNGSLNRYAVKGKNEFGGQGSAPTLTQLDQDAQKNTSEVNQSKIGVEELKKDEIFEEVVNFEIKEKTQNSTPSHKDNIPGGLGGILGDGSNPQSQVIGSRFNSEISADFDKTIPEAGSKEEDTHREEHKDDKIDPLITVEPPEEAPKPQILLKAPEPEDDNRGSQKKLSFSEAVEVYNQDQVKTSNLSPGPMRKSRRKSTAFPVNSRFSMKKFDEKEQADFEEQERQEQERRKQELEAKRKEKIIKKIQKLRNGHQSTSFSSDDSSGIKEEKVPEDPKKAFKNVRTSLMVKLQEKTENSEKQEIDEIVEKSNKEGEPEKEEGGTSPPEPEKSVPQHRKSTKKLRSIIKLRDTPVRLTRKNTVRFSRKSMPDNTPSSQTGLEGSEGTFKKLKSQKSVRFSEEPENSSKKELMLPSEKEGFRFKRRANKLTSMMQQIEKFKDKIEVDDQDVYNPQEWLSEKKETGNLLVTALKNFFKKYSNFTKNSKK